MTLKPRNRIPVIILIGIVAIATLCIVSAIVMNGSTERELRVAYKQLDDSMRTHDLAAFMAGLTADYTEQRTMTAKIKSRSESESNYRLIMADWNDLHDQHVDIYRISARNGSATVIAERTAAATVTDHRGTFGKKGQTHVVRTTTMEVDAWQKHSGRWLLRNRSVTTIKMTVDNSRILFGIPDEHSHEQN